jgi:hypothetical protein
VTGNAWDDYEEKRRHTELEHLHWHWSEAYVISWSRESGFLIQRRDDRSTFSAETGEEARDKIIKDYTARPVPRPPEISAPKPFPPLGSVSGTRRGIPLEVTRMLARLEDELAAAGPPFDVEAGLRRLTAALERAPLPDAGDGRRRA